MLFSLSVGDIEPHCKNTFIFDYSEFFDSLHRSIVERTMQIDPDKRFATATEMKEALLRVTKKETTQAMTTRQAQTVATVDVGKERLTGSEMRRRVSMKIFGATISTLASWIILDGAEKVDLLVASIATLGFVGSLGGYVSAFKTWRLKRKSIEEVRKEIEETEKKIEHGEFEIDDYGEYSSAKYISKDNFEIALIGLLEICLYPKYKFSKWRLSVKPKTPRNPSSSFKIS